MRKIGIQTSAFFGRKNFESGFEFIKSCGFECIDYAGLLNPTSEYGQLPLSVLEAKMREIKLAADNTGIGIYQMHGPWMHPLPNSTTEERKAWTDYAKKCIIASAELGSPRYVVHPIMPFGYSGEEDTEVYLEENRKFLTELCRCAKDVGVVICFENMPFPKQSLYTPCHMRDFIKEIPHDNIAVCLDTGHTMFAGLTLENSVRELGSCIQALHVHDTFKGGDHHLMPFSGIGDWTGFAAAVRDCIPESVPMMLETAPSGKIPTEIRDNLFRCYAGIAKYLVNCNEEYRGEE